MVSDLEMLRAIELLKHGCNERNCYDCKFNIVCRQSYDEGDNYEYFFNISPGLWYTSELKHIIYRSIIKKGDIWIDKIYYNPHKIEEITNLNLVICTDTKSELRRIYKVDDFLNIFERG